MATRNRVQYRYSVDFPNPRDSHMVSLNWVIGFVDMLRFDAARVEKCDSHSVELVSPHHPEERRWHSFGITPYAIRDERMPS